MKYSNQYFDEQFINYSQEYGNGWGMNWRAYMKLRMELATKIVKGCISKKSKCNILEVGCATGDFLDTILDSLRKNKDRIIGTDISEIAISICEDKYRSYDYMEFVNVALPNLMYKEEFDCIICMDVLEYFDSKGKEECINNLGQCLKIDGQLVLQVPLGTENEKEIIDIVKKNMEIQLIDYVYGRIWFSYFEKPLMLVINTLLINNRLGAIGKSIGKLAYRICSSTKLVKKAFIFNEKYFPNKRSHVVIVATKQ